MSKFLEILFGRFIPDIPSGFKALTKQAFFKIDWQSSGYEVESEIAVKVAKKNLDFVTTKIETIYHDTAKGMTIVDGLRIIKSLVQWRLGI